MEKIWQRFQLNRIFLKTISNNSSGSSKMRQPVVAVLFNARRWEFDAETICLLNQRCVTFVGWGLEEGPNFHLENFCAIATLYPLKTDPANRCCINFLRLAKWFLYSKKHFTVCSIQSRFFVTHAVVLRISIWVASYWWGILFRAVLRYFT